MKKLTMRNDASLAIGALLVILGGLFLILQFVNFSFGEWMWPFFIIVPGLLFFVAMVLGGRSTGALAIPGSIITTIGLLLFYQNVFHHFESWAYAWALIPLAVGIGIMINGYWSERSDLVKRGSSLIGTSAILFLIGCVFFEFVLKIGRFGHLVIGNIIGPLLLIVVGIVLVWRYWRMPPTTSIDSTPPSEPARPGESISASSTADPIVENKG